MSWRIIDGDCRDALATLPERSVQTCVTSPPYFGLRDYGHEGQIGLEPTPDEFVAALVGVFREVRRVLRDDGTVWLNLGDSYTAGAGSRNGLNASGLKRNVKDEDTRLRCLDENKVYRAPAVEGVSTGVKPKDLIGVPWMVAFALRQPYYAGKITSELDRVWLAAMIDAEGCIFVHHRAPAGERKSHTYGPGLEVANTSRAIVERCKALTGVGSISVSAKDRRQTLYRWTCRTEECRSVLREAYPYLVAKQQQARLAIGCPSSGGDAVAAWEALKLLHGGSDTTVDFKPPESLHTPGWYLRSDIIWSKLNPMPESVTDRPTKAHEYLFLLSKQPRYVYDADAIREPLADANAQRTTAHYDTAERYGAGNGGNGGLDSLAARMRSGDHAGANKRSVWTVATQPFAGAHFATMPPKLVEPCILAGSREGDIVLDPFSGAGTTGLVALRHDRSYIGIELNSEYAEMSRWRLRDDAPLLNTGLEEAA